MERKNFLKSLAIAAASGSIMLLQACKKASSTDSTTTATTSTNGVTPTEEEGPFPYPGGESTNPLQRSDVTDGQTGVQLTFTINVVNVNNNMAIVPNARVDMWQCNKDGYYSGYANQPGVLGPQSYVGKTWLRGYQTSDANGQLKFTTIYPGWYSGRATHIHLEIFINGVLQKATQMAFTESVSDVVHVSTLYAAHGINPTRNATDSVFGNSAADLAVETLVTTGSVSAGFTAVHTIALAL